MIRLNHRASWHGPNPLSLEPVIVVDIAVADEQLAGLLRASTNLQILSADWYLPAKHSDDLNCSDEASGEVLGTFLADWALQALTYVRGYLGVAGCRRVSNSQQVQIWLGFHEVALSVAALQLGAKWLVALAAGKASAAEFEQQLASFWQACRQYHPDYQARIIMEAARQRGLPYRPAWGLARHWQFGQGRHSRVFFETSSCADGLLGGRVEASKASSKTVISAMGLPTPDHVLITEEKDLAQALKRIGFPCVLKPLDRGQGKGVSANLNSLEDARQGFRIARSFSRAPIMVEAFMPGNDYRLMVVGGRLRVVIRRDPPHIVGDGHKTVAQLVSAKNVGRDIRSPVRSRFMWPIELDGSAQIFLAGQNLSADSVLAAGQRVFVRSNSNLSTGGDCTDVTDTVHPHIKIMAETLAQSLNLQMMGADYQTADISLSPQQMAGGFIEINTTPGFSTMVAAGWSAQQAGALALGDDLGRIATRLMLVPDDALAATEATLSAQTWQPDCGWASETRAELGGCPLRVQQKTPAAGTVALLAHRALRSAVIVLTPAQLYRHGMPLAEFDEVVVQGVALASGWNEVLQRCTPRLKNLRNINEF